MPTQSTDERLSLSSIRARYNNPTAFGPVDAWHRYTAGEVSRLITQHWSPSRDAGPILNAGSGGSQLDVESGRIINLDLAEWRLRRQPRAVVANIETLPLASQSMSAVICVGSVINYCDVASAISEFGRVLRKDGDLVLEFESSLSGEYLTTRDFGGPVVPCETFYCGRKELVWAYRLEYVQNLVVSAQMLPRAIFPIHVVSPWALLCTSSLGFAAAIGRADPVARRIPGLTRWASNFLMICKKR